MKRKQRGDGTRAKIAERQGIYGCNRCKQVMNISTITVDHICPISRGGEDEMYNLQLLCRPCHRMKTVTDKYKYL